MDKFASSVEDATYKRDTNESEDDSEETDIALLMKMASMTTSEKVPPLYKGTGFVYSDIFEQHQCEFDSKYPECPDRVIFPLARCKELDLVERCITIPLSYASEDQIQWHHSSGHFDLARRTSCMSEAERTALAKKFDSWYCNEATFECSLAAAGAVLTLVDHIIHGKVTNGFALVRPPGHHAMENEFSGYCTFNSVSIATTHALNLGLERILIVDWDVHHGQGTQYAFYSDSRVLYFSIHRYEHGRFWPNLRQGDYHSIGESDGKGYNINVPLNQTGMGDADYMMIMQQLLLPVAHEFSPQVIIVSAGYDAAVGCPEGEMSVSPAAFAHFTHLLIGVSAGRLCVVLEGGYCLPSLSESCALTLRCLLGDPCPLLPPMFEPCDSAVSSLLNAVKVLRPHWSCLSVFDTTLDMGVYPFQDVTSLSPVDDVIFSTDSNRASIFDVNDDYLTQSRETVEHFAAIIHALIAETSLSKAPYRVCFVFDAAMRKHRNVFDRSHPESPDRISDIFDKHRDWGLLDRCHQLKSRFATDEEVLLVHESDYLEEMKGTAHLDNRQLQNLPHQRNYNSIYICQSSYRCALMSSGCVLQAVDAVLLGKAQSGVSVVRPPGHHAECDRAMGFCFFNNVAIAAVYASKKYSVKRILILDWDVHHGNSTQHIFYRDPSVLYISIHRYDNGNFFPGSREADLTYVGESDGTGFNVNIPWSEQCMGDAEYMCAFQSVIMPIAYEYGPELVLVSAGFDASAGDPLGGFLVTPECYGQMAHMLSSLANGRVILALEGGYNLSATSTAMALCTSVLLGDPCPHLYVRTPSAHAITTVRKVIHLQKPYWNCLKFAVPVPYILEPLDRTTSDQTE